MSVILIIARLAVQTGRGLRTAVLLLELPCVITRFLDWGRWCRLHPAIYRLSVIFDPRKPTGCQAVKRRCRETSKIATFPKIIELDPVAQLVEQRTFNP